MKGHKLQLREKVVFSVYDVKIFNFFFLNHTACRVILLSLDLVVLELHIVRLILKKGKRKLWQAIGDQVKSEFK